MQNAVFEILGDFAYACTPTGTSDYQLSSARGGLLTERDHEV
jgi:hypothetical protein